MVLSDEVWIGTSWKMTTTLGPAKEYARRLAAADVPETVRLFVLPPLTAFAAVRECLPTGGPVLLGAQNAHWAEEGPWTGEVSMGMLRDAGASLVEVGHSERREHFGETDEDVARKVRAAVDHQLVPLVCFGEPRSVRDAGGAEDSALSQVRAAVRLLDPGEIVRVMLAYEPVWAIGSAGRPAEPDEIDPVLGAVAQELGAIAAGGTLPPLLYGGSVDQANARELLDGPHTDGLFVGRAAWHVDGLLELMSIGAAHVRDLGRVSRSRIS